MSTTVTLTADPEMRYSANGKPVARFTVVTSRRVKGQQTGDWSDADTSFWDCMAFGQLAENVAENLTKGTAVIVTGSAAQEEWTTKDGRNAGRSRSPRTRSRRRCDGPAPRSPRPSGRGRARTGPRAASPPRPTRGLASPRAGTARRLLSDDVRIACPGHCEGPGGRGRHPRLRGLHPLDGRKLSLGSHGYAQMYELVEDGAKTTTLVHRWVMGATRRDGRIVDHVNRDRLDDRKVNLRFVTASESSANVKARAASGYRGVYRVRNKWHAKGKFGGVTVHLGAFKTPEEAGAVAHAWRLANLPGYTGRDIERDSKATDPTVAGHTQGALFYIFDDAGAA